MKYILSLIVCLCFVFNINAQHKVRATKYYPGHNCGWVTADGSSINYNKLLNKSIRWVALSRDMFIKHGFELGDIIIVDSDNPCLKGEWIVKDKMGPRKTMSIDFLFAREHKGFDNPCKVIIRKKIKYIKY